MQMKTLWMKSTFQNRVRIIFHSVRDLMKSIRANDTLSDKVEGRAPGFPKLSVVCRILALDGSILYEASTGSYSLNTQQEAADGTGYAFSLFNQELNLPIRTEYTNNRGDVELGLKEQRLQVAVQVAESPVEVSDVMTLTTFLNVLPPLEPVTVLSCHSGNAYAAPGG